MSLVPFYTQFFMVAIFGILDRDDIADFFLSKIEDSILSNVIEFMRALRLLRLVHLSTHMSTLRMISDVVKDSREQLFFLMFIFAFSSIGFGTLFYLFEHSPGCGPTSIPDAMWWSSSTITTLGYGDLFPVTNAGKVCAVVCSIMGVLAISLPLPAIVNSYQRVKNREKIEKMRQVYIIYSPLKGIQLIFKRILALPPSTTKKAKTIFFMFDDRKAWDFLR